MESYSGEAATAASTSYVGVTCNRLLGLCSIGFRVRWISGGHTISINAGAYIKISNVSYVFSVKFCKAEVWNFNYGEGDLLS